MRWDLAAQSAAKGPASRESENPDRASWIDLAERPFRPEWVGGQLVQLRGPFQSLNALRRESADVERLHKWLLGTPLLMEDADASPSGFVVRPWAAKQLPVTSSDGLVGTFTLRTDLTWEDGKPVTAQDFAWTFEMMRKPLVDTALRDAMEAIDAVVATDASTLRVTLKRPSIRGIVAFGLDFPVLPSHALSTDPVALNATRRHLSSGPYRVAAHDGGRLDLRLRDDAGGRPFRLRPHYIERILFEAPGDATADSLRMRSGQIGIAGLSADTYVAAASDAQFNAVAWRTAYTLPAYQFIAWNLKDPNDSGRAAAHPVLGDVRVRKALSCLLDIDALIAGPLAGLATRSTGPFPPVLAAADPAAKPPTFDPARAASLLDEAGFRRQPDGKRRKGDVEAAFTILRPISRNPAFALPCDVLAEEAAKIGVRITVTPAAAGQIIEAGRTGRFDGAMLIWTVDSIEPDVRTQWHSSTSRTDGDNWSGLADAEVDRILDAIDRELDPLRREQLRRDLHRRVADLQPSLFLWSPATALAISRRIANVRIHDLGLRWWDLVDRELLRKFPP